MENFGPKFRLNCKYCGVFSLIINSESIFFRTCFRSKYYRYNEFVSTFLYEINKFSDVDIFIRFKISTEKIFVSKARANTWLIEWFDDWLDRSNNRELIASTIVNDIWELKFFKNSITNEVGVLIFLKFFHHWTKQWPLSKWSSHRGLIATERNTTCVVILDR